MALHLPVEAWGRSYYTMNFYQDSYGTKTTSHRPSQVLVISRFDSTVVTYRPIVETEGSQAIPAVAKGVSKTIVLNSGETFLIKAAVDQTKTRSWETDLSGTFIESNKPIGVVSGHTKVGIMRYPDYVPGFGGTGSAHFLRNNVHDCLLPNEFASTRFVTLPIKYTSHRKTGKPLAQLGVEDDRGDVIRVIATQDSTTVRAMRKDGSGFITKWTLNRGESAIDPAQEDAVYWESDKPILMGQYGKSYANLSTSRVDKVHDMPLDVSGHPNVDAGMPMFQVVPPLERAVNYGCFNAPSAMDNYVNIVFKVSEMGKITLNGLPLTRNSVLNRINGTEYGFIQTSVSNRAHTIASVDDTVKWIAWSYGSLDGLMQGHAYGTPVAYNMYRSCDDSIAVSSRGTCGNIVSTAYALPGDLGCSEIRDVVTLQSDNFDVKNDWQVGASTKVFGYSLVVKNSRKNARARLQIVTQSGRYVNRLYTYVVDSVQYSPSIVQFGAVALSKPTLRTVSIRNVSPTRPITITGFRMKNRGDVLSISTPVPLQLQPLESKDISIVANIVDTAQITDTLVCEYECSQQLASRIVVRGLNPVTVDNDLPSDVNDQLQLRAVTPNPATGHVDITFLATNAATVELVTMQGRSVRSQQVLPGLNQVVLSLSGVSTGIYWVVLSDAVNTPVVARLLVTGDR
jgi:hypothetical protein